MKVSEDAEVTKQFIAYTHRYGTEISNGEMPTYDNLSPEEKASICESCGTIIDSEKPIDEGEEVVCGDCE